MKKIFNRETISYIFFGGLTTVVYFVTRFSVVKATDNSMLGVVLAQIAAILFAYFVNKIFVFKDKNWGFLTVLKQLFGFIIGRLLVFGLDLSITYLTVKRFSEFFIRVLFLDKLNYDHFIFSNVLTNRFIGNEKLLNEFIFALLVQILAIVINYIISKKAIFVDKEVEKETLKVGKEDFNDET